VFKIEVGKIYSIEYPNNEGDFEGELIGTTYDTAPQYDFRLRDGTLRTVFPQGVSITPVWSFYET
jgi:hypothetical protein